MSWRTDLRRLRTADRRDVGRAIEALLWLGLIRVGLGWLSFRRFTSLLGLSEVAVEGRPGEAPSGGGGGGATATATSLAVGQAIRVAAARAPWDSTCLIRSLTGHVMLRRRRISSTVHLGVANGASGDIVAHSWLDSGGSVITGDHGHDAFTPIAALVRSRRA